MAVERPNMAGEGTQGPENISGIPTGETGTPTGEPNVVVAPEATRIQSRPGFLRRIFNKQGQEVQVLVKPSPKEVFTNASLTDAERLQKAKELLETPQFTPGQEKAILEAHQVGVDKPGEDNNQAGVYNYTQPQLRQKAEILKEDGFSKEQRRALIESGLVGVIPPSEYNSLGFDPLAYASDPLLSDIAAQVNSNGIRGRADETFFNRTAMRIEGLLDQNRVDPTLALNFLNEVESLRIIAEHPRLPEERNPLWDRSWGRIILTGRTPDEVRQGINNFLEVATDEESNFDPQRNIEDANQLNQEIQRVGQMAGMERGEILEQVARAEGTLLINTADWFAVRWNVKEWHQVASMIGRHINSRLNAVSKAHQAEVMHASDILDNDEDFDQFGRPARFASEKSSWNDEAAASKRNQTRRRLEVRIALSQLKDINTVIREHFTGIETLIDSFGFNRGANTPAKDLFENTNYLTTIGNIDKKISNLNNGVVGAPQLTADERRLIDLDRFRLYERTEDLVVIDQTDQQFRNLYVEYGGFGAKERYDARIQRLEGVIPRLRQKIKNNEQLTDQEKKWIRFWERDQLLKNKVEKGKKLTNEEKRAFPEVARAIQAVDLAIKTRDVFFISAEKACASLKTRRNISGEGEGELLSYNDVVRFNKFVRERAIASLPVDAAKEITSATRDGQGLMYVDIADKLEFRQIARRTLQDKGADSIEGKNAKEALRVITLTKEEQKYENHVQAVEDVQDKVLEKLKEKGSSIQVSEIDVIIKEVFQDKSIVFDVNSRARADQLKSVHRGKTKPEPSTGYRDIVNREDADPQYNFSMIDDQKYSSLLLSDEIKAAAYNPDHPYHLSIPATTRRVLDPDGNKLTRQPDPDLERLDCFRVMETQRRFHFATDSVKVFGAFYSPYPYDTEVKKPTVSEIVENIRNSPFIARRMIEQRVWTLWNRGQAYRGRGFLKYLESNFRGLDHSVGAKGLRGIIAAYNGFSNPISNPKGFDYTVNFSGSLDELKAELWLEQAVSADAIRPILVGGQVGQDPNFEGLFKKIVKTIGRNNYDYASVAKGMESSKPVLVQIANRNWEYVTGGDYEKAITEIEDRWGRVTIYGKSLGFVGNTNHGPLAAKFSGDTAIRRMVYWAVAHPESVSAYTINMDLTRAILEPLPESTDVPKTKDNTEGKQTYFGIKATLLTELMRREILVK